MTTTTLKVRGMHCASCVNHVERNLKKVPGVESASVNLATEEATVRHDESKAPVAKLVAAVVDAGYEAEVPGGDGDRDDEEDSGRGFRVLGVGFREAKNHPAATDHPPLPTPNTQHPKPFLQLTIASLAIPVVVLGMLWHHSIQSALIQLALATPVQIVLGWPFYKGAFKAARHGRADMDTLVALGTSVAYFYSLIVTLNAVTEHGWNSHVLGVYLDTLTVVTEPGWSSHRVAVYFDTAVVILVLIGLGKWLEARARSSAAAAIRGLMNLQPPQATVIRGGNEITLAVSQVHSGDVVLVRPGQRVPVDGLIAEGRSTLDQSMVTGESMPAEVGPGDAVIAGTLNQTGAFRFTATKTGKDMFLSQVIELVRQAQASKANVQRIADRVAGVFVPVVLFLAVSTYFMWVLVDQPPVPYEMALKCMIAVLIVACPCALGLATPTAIMVGTGLGAREGILIKDAAALERAGKLTHVILDKTGTLTIGRPAVTDVVPIQVGSRKSEVGSSANSDFRTPTSDFLRLAASVESASEHPLGRAIVEYAKEEDVAPAAVSDFLSITAGGVRGRVDGSLVIVGKPQTLREQGVRNLDALTEPMERLQAAGRTVVAVAVDGEPVGVIGLADPLKEDAAQVVEQLHRLGLKVMLMTGDHELAARAVAKELGIDDVMAQVLPQDKQARVVELQRQGGRVAMVGDGINDAPALAAADIGIAMGGPGGTDIAAAAGHVVLLNGELAGLPRAIALSRATMKRIHMGLFWAFAYNVVLIPLAALGYLHPMLAAGAMALSSVSVVLNALWLRWAWETGTIGYRSRGPEL